MQEYLSFQWQLYLLLQRLNSVSLAFSSDKQNLHEEGQVELAENYFIISHEVQYLYISSMKIGQRPDYDKE